jgi:hypothetical protein
MGGHYPAQHKQGSESRKKNFIETNRHLWILAGIALAGQEIIGGLFQLGL